jgi:hypothetical protein
LGKAAISDVGILEEMRRRAFAALLPPKREPFSQWIKGSIILPQGLTAVPGPMRLYLNDNDLNLAGLDIGE